MRKSRFTESQIVAILKEGEAGVSIDGDSPVGVTADYTAIALALVPEFGFRLRSKISCASRREHQVQRSDGEALRAVPAPSVRIRVR